jgi:hypothetical protein
MMLAAVYPIREAGLWDGLSEDGRTGAEQLVPLPMMSVPPSTTRKFIA